MKPQTAAVLRLLEDRPEGVTSMDALLAGCGSRLAGRIHELRADGFPISGRYWVTPNGARVVRYRLDRPRFAPTTGEQEGLSL